MHALDDPKHSELAAWLITESGSKIGFITLSVAWPAQAGRSKEASDKDGMSAPQEVIKISRPCTQEADRLNSDAWYVHFDARHAHVVLPQIATLLLRRYSAGSHVSHVTTHRCVLLPTVEGLLLAVSTEHYRYGVS